jgi:hypothetical protein
MVWEREWRVRSCMYDMNRSIVVDEDDLVDIIFTPRNEQ